MKQIKIPYLSYGLWRYLERWRPFFEPEKISVGHQGKESSVLGWGYKRSGQRALALAQKSPVHTALLIEDGFLRSVGLGVEGYPPLSLVVDDLGIYYDASKPSRLENLILDNGALEPFLEDAKRAIALITEHHLSKYNHVKAGWPAHLEIDESKKQVLVIDQTAGDMALVYGGVTPETFEAMITAAKAENPEADIWVKIHPDVLAGKKKGHLTGLLDGDNIRILSENINPISLLEKMDRVYTATSQMGFEALMLGKEVVTFGLSWYAGWGITDDRHAKIQALQQAERRKDRTLEELFAAAYLRYCRYLNPFTKERGDIFDLLKYFVMAKERAILLEGEILCVGLSWWKKRIIKPFLTTYNNKVHFFKTLKACELYSQNHPKPNELKVMIWGQKYPQVAKWATEVGIPLLRMEDGFIRSVGLGSNLVPPLSLVIDDRGIYFDARTPSRLEDLLQHHSFNDAELEMADCLISNLIEKHIGKYNVGSGGVTLPNPRPETVILIPGQVEEDASIRFGSERIKTNLELVQAVRKENPKAYLIYKPHPDVVSGNRKAITTIEDARKYVDDVVIHADILSCIQAVDEVHTMTSLSGFEALLRKKKVTCYGAPFYSGWGLTTDKQLVNRRTRTLTLAELVAGSMLLYPTYINPETGELMDALTALTVLEAMRKERHSEIKTHWLERKWNQLRALYRVYRHSR